MALINSLTSEGLLFCDFWSVSLRKILRQINSCYAGAQCWLYQKTSKMRYNKDIQDYDKAKGKTCRKVYGCTYKIKGSETRTHFEKKSSPLSYSYRGWLGAARRKANRLVQNPPIRSRVLFTSLWMFIFKHPIKPVDYWRWSAVASLIY